MHNSQLLPGIDATDLRRAGEPLDRAWTLPPAAYTDASVYDAEVERLMRTGWLPVARVEQLPMAGSYLTMDLLGQPIVVVRGSDDQIRVMSSICLHRAANIVEGSGRRNVFTCPYHAWSYDTTGQLKRAPLMEGACEFAERDERLPQIRSEIWQGFILANLDDEAAPFAPQVKGLNDYFDAFRLEDMVLVDTLEFDSPWNWKVLVENFMEAYHHIATHSKTFEPVFHAADSRVLDSDGPWSILHMPAADQEHTDPGGLPNVPGLEPWQERDLFASVMYPHFLLAVQGSSAAWYQVLPDAVDHLTLKIHLLVPATTTQIDGFAEASKALREVVSAVHHEDISANDLVWRGLNAGSTKQGRLSPLEKAIWQQNQWWLGKMADG